MPKGFFPASVWMTGNQGPTGGGLIPKCGACGLKKLCKSPMMPVDGEGRLKILVVGEAPGGDEDAEGRPFIGRAGQFLNDSLKQVGISLRKDCWITNSIICRPPGNETPSKQQIEYCRPNLLKTLRELKPVVILVLGHTSVEAVVGSSWKSDVGPMTKWAGWQIPSTNPNAWICPTFHPSYMLRVLNDRQLGELHRRTFLSHLKPLRELAERGRPWDEVPDWNKCVRVFLDPEEAAREILRVNALEPEFSSLDIEATALKPEYPGFQILCCSLCWRKDRAIAYPWKGAAIKATREILRNPRIGKIAANMKYEDRAFQHYFKEPVRNWVWDTMLAAHVLDNRPDICGLKFQAYVNLGAESYDDDIKTLLKARKGKKTNLADTEIDFPRLMQYCGTDDLHEYNLALLQMRLMSGRSKKIGAGKS